MKVSSVSLLVSIIFCTSCVNDGQLTFVKVDELEFHPGFLSNHKYIGIINENERMFYFGDPVTNKKIKFFRMNGELAYTVPLQSALSKVNSIKHFQVVSLDTILVFGDYNGKIAVIDRKGEIWRYRDLTKEVKPYNNVKVYYSTSYSGRFYQNGTLFMHFDYAAEHPEDENLQPKEYFAYALDYPYFLKIDNVLDTGLLDYSFSLNRFYRRFMSDSCAMTEPFRYSLLGNQMLISSIFSDSLYFISENFDRVESAIQIKSNRTSIGVRPVRLFEEDYMEYLNEEVSRKGYIAKVLYDKNKDFYLVVVCGKYSKSAPEDYEVTYCFYSRNGDKIEEVTFPIKKFTPKLIFEHDSKYHILVKTQGERKFNPEIDNYKFNVYEIH